MLSFANEVNSLIFGCECFVCDTNYVMALYIYIYILENVMGFVVALI